MNELPLQLKNLTKDYGSKRALDSVSLNIGAGERVGLVGPNGAGKSTLIKMIMGLIHPTAGSVKSTAGSKTSCNQAIGPSSAMLPTNLCFMTT